MEEFRVCTVEAQAATEDIREEISTVISIFNSRHQNVRLHRLAQALCQSIPIYEDSRKRSRIIEHRLYF